MWWARRSIAKGKQPAVRGDFLIRPRNGRPQAVREILLCPRRDGEPDQRAAVVFVCRPFTATLRANQLRLWLSSVAYTLLVALRQFGLQAPRWPRPVRYDPAEAPEDRRGGDGERTAGAAADEPGHSSPGRVHRRLPCLGRRGALSRHHEPDNPLSLVPAIRSALSAGSLSLKIPLPTPPTPAHLTKPRHARLPPKISTPCEKCGLGGGRRLPLDLRKPPR